MNINYILYILRENILTILSVFLTFILGTVSIWLTFKFRKIIKLTYIKNKSLSLFHSIVKNLDGIEIIYDKKPVNESIIFLKSSFVNSGKVDIDLKIIHKPLTVILPQNFKWLKAKIIKTSPEIKCKCFIKDERTLEFKWDLLKPDEFFTFDSLIQAPLDNKNNEEKILQQINKKIKFTHRITNLNKVTEDIIISDKRKMAMGYFMIIIVLITGFMYTAIPIFIKPLCNIRYILMQPNNQEIIVDIVGMSNNTIKLKSIQGNFEDILKPTELFNKYQLTPIVVEDKKAEKWIFCLLGIIMIFSCLIFYFLKVNPSRKMIKILNIEQLF